MKQWLLFFLLVLLPDLSFTETGKQTGSGNVEYFKSNSLGMLIQKIADYRKDEYPYIVVRTRRDKSETRVLLNDNVEVNKWETEYGDNMAVKSEKEYKEQVLQKVYFYNSRRVLTEEQFYTEGVLSRKVLYFYEGKNTLLYTKAYDGEGNLLYQDDYFLTNSGRLREVKRTWNDGRFEKASFIQGSGKLAQETETNNARTIVSRFDALSRPVIKENWKGEKLLQREEYTYFADTDKVNTLKEKNFSSGRTYIRIYDQEGNLNSETVQKDDTQISRLEFAWDSNGNKIEERERSAAGLIVRKYYYDAANALTSEEQYTRGSLEVKTVYLEDDEFYKEYYNQKGEAVIRAYFRADVKYKEEVLDKGKVILTREVQ